MKEGQSPPDFDAGSYERPNQRWVCGWKREGRPCRVGPDAAGFCQATFECTPVLRVQAEEEKGRFVCTRSAEFGGPCEDGPLPDGTCGRRIPRCAPVRSLRSLRGAFTLFVVALTTALLFIALGGPRRLKIINPGSLSPPHSGEAFSRQQGVQSTAAGACDACHPSARDDLLQWIPSALAADPRPLEFSRFAQASPIASATIDQACERCHLNHAFHQPNVVKPLSCLACHQEHHGSLALMSAATSQCRHCHGDAGIMEAASQKGMGLPGEIFLVHAVPGRQPFALPRPSQGFTRVFQAFAEDHPEFRIVEERRLETNSLHFNHRRHLAEDVPPVAGQRLACASCHVPDASGARHLPIRFESHCRSCHRLQIDPSHPELEVPHGNADAARAFLRDLSVQYADLARRQKGLSGGDVEVFVREQLDAMRLRVRSADELEARVFLSTGRSAPMRNAGALVGSGAPVYQGCAFCHEVFVRPDGAPRITPLSTPDRWFTHGSFDHARHRTVQCTACHAAATSSATADILLPSKADCIRCHSPQGGIRSDCVTCHRYHRGGSAPLMLGILPL